MTIHAQTSRTAPSQSEPATILERMERLIARDPDGSLPRDLLERESLWKKLSPGEAHRWALLAQAAGLLDLSLRVLTWIIEHHPDHQPSRLARLDLLETLGRTDDAGPVAALSAGETGAGVGTSAGTGSPHPAAAEAGAGFSGSSLDIDSPFLSMRREEERLGRFLQLFQGREDCFARQWADRRNATQGYVPVRRPMTAADVRDHVRGLKTYGIYLLQCDSRVRLAVVDADLAPRFRNGNVSARDRDLVRREKSYLLDRLPELSLEAGLPCLVEFSGGKGFHFWYFFREPVPAAAARQALQQAARRLEPDLSCFTLEVFPKQDQLAGKGLGNLVKLPLGLHRGTGKRSFFVHVQDRSVDAQLSALETVRLIPANQVAGPDSPVFKGRVVPHPSLQNRAGAFPELGLLAERCAALGGILSGCRRSRELSVREEKILMGTLGFLPRGRTLLHHVLQDLPEYNPHLVDYKLSRLRGTPMGCRRIHSLLNMVRDFCPLPDRNGYSHPLLHWPEWESGTGPARAERIVNLQDALENLKTAVGIVQRFLQGRREPAAWKPDPAADGETGREFRRNAPDDDEPSTPSACRR